MKSYAVTVGTTAVVAVAASDENRTVYVQRFGGNSIFLGGSDVTTATAVAPLQNQLEAIFVPAKQTLHAVAGAANQTLLVLMPS
jgi:hypothetical protein